MADRDVDGTNLCRLLRDTADDEQRRKETRFSHQRQSTGPFYRAVSAKELDEIGKTSRIPVAQQDRWPPYDTDEVVFLFDGTQNSKAALEAARSLLNHNDRCDVVEWNPGCTVTVYEDVSAVTCGCWRFSVVHKGPVNLKMNEWIKV